jgi:hypothetical protein
LVEILIASKMVNLTTIMLADLASKTVLGKLDFTVPKVLVRFEATNNLDCE